LIFLIESGFIGLIGGVIGILIGFILAKSVEFIAISYLATSLLKPAFPLYLIAGSLLFSFLIGSISGLLPARQASKLKPVDALRYE
jgi:putative ABC transport system permease protein